jgi:Family of unknown function (DUF6491)
MKSLIIVIAMLFAAGCSSISEREQEYEQDKQKSLAAIEETRAFVEETKPQEVTWARFDKPLHYEYLNNQYVILDTRTTKYLIQVRNYCPELSSTTLTPDLADSRSSFGMLRVNSDKLRGCVIDAIYVLSGEAETRDGEEP